MNKIEETIQNMKQTLKTANLSPSFISTLKKKIKLLEGSKSYQDRMQLQMK